jgi:DNA-binding NarL/FixJ family response regulator
MTTPEQITVSLVEDDAGIRESLSVLINGTAGYRCLATYPTAEAALEQLPRHWPDVLIMDINLPKLSGVECVARLKAQHPELDILMFTVDDDSDSIFRALQEGASGYLVKGTPPAEILSAIAEVHRGGSPMSTHIARTVVRFFQQPRPQQATEATSSLSEREREIVNCLAKGYRYKEIADVLTISQNTVRSHIRRIYEKLHVTSRTEAAMKLAGEMRRVR